MLTVDFFSLVLSNSFSDLTFAGIKIYIWSGEPGLPRGQPEPCQQKVHPGLKKKKQPLIFCENHDSEHSLCFLCLQHQPSPSTATICQGLKF